VRKKEESESKQDRIYRIDVHHHMVPREYVKVLADEGLTASLGNKFPEWSVERVSS
jgi:6-methylsalicylate decarboxylase